MTFRVGLTGGIGCGKSKAADAFAELGAAVIDTDAISHALTGPRGEAMPAVEKEFGTSHVNADGSLNRASMRALVFSDPEAKRRLEAILHPMIRAEVSRQAGQANAPYVILVVPLLFETGAYRDTLDRVLVVDCPEEQQISRTMARSSLTESEVRAIMAAQIARAERVSRADDVLPNDSDLNALRERVRALHAQYLRAAAGHG